MCVRACPANTIKYRMSYAPTYCNWDVNNVNNYHPRSIPMAKTSSRGYIYDISYQQLLWIVVTNKSTDEMLPSISTSLQWYKLTKNSKLQATSSNPYLACTQKVSDAQFTPYANIGSALLAIAASTRCRFPSLTARSNLRTTGAQICEAQIWCKFHLRDRLSAKHTSWNMPKGLFRMVSVSGILNRSALTLCAKAWHIEEKKGYRIHILQICEYNWKWTRMYVYKEIYSYKYVYIYKDLI